MADQNLTVTITADAAGAAPVIQTVEQRLGALEQAFIRSTSATKAHGEAHKEDAEHMKHAHEEAGGLSEGLKDLAEHSRIAAIGFEQLGLEADAGAAKLAGLAEVVELVGKAAPELLAVGLAVGGLAIAFGTLAEAIEAAAKSEAALVSVGALVRNQSEGGDEWKKQTKEIGEYAEALSKASVFAKTDFLDGMRAMLVAGVSVNDMLRSQQAAQDLAGAKGIDLKMAEEELAQAYDGRLIGLKRLGLVTEEEVKSGLPYEELLTRIEERMKGSAASAMDTYAGKVKNLANIYDALLDGAGTAFLPVMNAIVDAERAAVAAAEPLGEQWSKWVAENLPALQAGVGGFATLLSSIATEVLPVVLSAFEGTLLALARFGKWVGDNAGPINALFNVVIGTGAVIALRALAGAIGAAGVALAEFVVSETAATFGLNVLIAGIIQGAFWLNDNWDSAMHSLTLGFAGFVGSVESGVARVLYSISTMMHGVAHAIKGIPLVGGAMGGAADGAGNMLAGLAAKAASAANASTANALQIPLKGTGQDMTAGLAEKKAEHKAPEFHASDHDIPGTSSDKAAKMVTTRSSYTDDAYNPTPVDRYAEAQKRLEEQLKAATRGEGMFAEAVRLARTEGEQKSAQTALEAKQIADLRNEQTLLTSAISKQSDQVFGLRGKWFEADAAARAAVKAENDYGNATNTGDARTTDQENYLAKLKSTATEAKKAADELAKGLAEVSAQALKNGDTLATVNDKLDAFKEKAPEAAAAASRAWDAFSKRNSETLLEDVRTFGMSNAQKLAFYTDSLARLGALNANNEKEAERLESARTSAFKGELQDRENAHKAFIDNAKATETSFLDDVLSRTKSFGESLHNLWTNIASQLTKNLEATIVGGMGGLNGGLASLFGAGGSSSGGGGIFGGLLGGSASSGIASAKVTNGALDVNIKGADPSYLTAVTGSSQGIPGLPSLGGGSSSGAGGGGLSSLFGGGAGGIGAGLSAGLGFGTAGAIGGGLISGITGGNKNGSSVGGFLGAGGVAGLLASSPFLAPLLATPWGIAAIAAAGLGGALLGGLFGGHTPNAQQNPDQAGDVQSYGQFVTNIGGDPAGHFGNLTIGAQQQYQTTSEGKQIYASLAAMNGAQLNSTMKPIYDKLVALEAGSKSDNALEIASEKNGTFTLKSGATIGVQDYQQLVQAYQNAGGSLSASSLSSQVFAVTRSMPDFNLGKLQANGTYNPVPTNVGGVGTTIGTPGTTGGAGAINGGITVNVQVGGKDVATAILPAVSTGLARQASATVPGGGRAYGTTVTARYGA